MIEMVSGALSYKPGMTMVILQGAFTLKPEERDRFVAASIDGMEASRAEAGCLEYVMAADPVDPGRVVLSERWESNEHLQRHLENIGARRGASGGPPSDRPVPLSQEITVYDVSGTRRLGS